MTLKGKNKIKKEAETQTWRLEGGNSVRRRRSRRRSCGNVKRLQRSYNCITTNSSMRSSVYNTNNNIVYIIRISSGAVACGANITSKTSLWCRWWWKWTVVIIMMKHPHLRRLTSSWQWFCTITNTIAMQLHTPNPTSSLILLYISFASLSATQNLSFLIIIILIIGPLSLIGKLFFSIIVIMKNKKL